MFFFFFHFPEGRPENNDSLTDFDSREIKCAADVHEEDYNTFTDFKDILRLLVICRCIYLQNRDNEDFNGVDFNTDLRSILKPFDERLGTNPNPVSIKDLYYNFINFYDLFSQSNPDDIISEYLPEYCESAPINLLKKIFHDGEETALVEYYLLFVSFDLYHDEPKHEIYHKYVNLSNGHGRLSLARFCRLIQRLFYNKRFIESKLLDVEAVHRQFQSFHAHTAYHEALVYFYAILYRDYKVAERKGKNNIKGLRVNEKTTHINSPQAVFTLTYSDNTYRPLNDIFNMTVYHDFKDSVDWEKNFSKLLILLKDFPIELYLNEFLPFVFVTPSTVIDYLKRVPCESKHSASRNVMELIVAFLYANGCRDSQEVFHRFLKERLHRDIEIDYQNVYEHLRMFTGTLAVNKSRIHNHYYNILSPIKALFISSNGKEPKDINEKLVDVYFHPGSYYKAMNSEVLNRYSNIPSLELLQIIDENSGDNMVENGILFDSYANDAVLSNKKNILLIQPSYSFLRKWITDYRTKNMTVTVLVYNKTIAECLQHTSKTLNNLVFGVRHSTQRGNKDDNPTFISELNLELRFDLAITFYNNVPTRMDDLLLISQIMDYNSVLYSVLPESFFYDEQYDSLREKIFGNLTINHITLFDSQLFGYQPKKKVMIECSHRIIEESQTNRIPITQYEIDKKTHRKSGRKVRPDGFLYYLKHPTNTRLELTEPYHGESIDIRERLQIQELPENYTPRNKAKMVILAPDFIVYYTSSPHGRGLQGYCYFTEYLEPSKKKKNQKGKMIQESRMTISARDEEELASSIYEEIPFRKNFRDTVSNAIQDSHDKGILPDLSMFTFAYGYYTEIKKRYGWYDDSYCMKLLSHSKLGSCTFNSPGFSEKFQKALDELEKIPEKLLLQLSYILDTARRKGFIVGDYSPISSLLDEEKKRNKTKAALHKALTTKTLSFAREKCIFEWLQKQIPESIVYLGTMIKLFTGMSTPEVCMLSWEDLKIIPETKSLGIKEYKYQLQITKQMKYDSTEKDVLKTPQKYRLVPLPNILVEELLGRYQELAEKYELTTEDIAKLPIISANSASYNERCKVKSLRDRSRTALVEGAGLDKKLVEYAEADGRTVEDDLNKYIGDFYVSNFKFHAKYDCSMTEGELSYILGIQPPDTFSKHYCDYSNDFIQVGLAEKLNDWCSIYKEWTGEPGIKHEKTRGDEKTKNTLVEPINSDCMSAHLEFPLESRNVKAIEISVSCDRGLSGTLSVYGGEIDG